MVCHHIEEELFGLEGYRCRKREICLSHHGRKSPILIVQDLSVGTSQENIGQQGYVVMKLKSIVPHPIETRIDEVFALEHGPGLLNRKQEHRRGERD